MEVMRFVDEKETVEKVISIVAAGGNASKKAKSCRISLPSSWVTDMGIDLDERDVILSYDGEKISIVKKN